MAKTHSADLVPADHDGSLGLPAILNRPAGMPPLLPRNFSSTIRNEHTRAAYLVAIKKFLAWAESRGLELVRISPKDVGQYFDGLRKQDLSVATRKQHLAALRHFFDGMVTRHAMILNPALSVRGERYAVVEGKTPEMTVGQARTLLKSLKTTVVGLRDRVIIAILVYTAARAGAVAGLKVHGLY